MRHLRRLTRSFIHDGEHISYIHVYARPLGPVRDAPLEFIAAEETGAEGIACVDDAARFPVYREVGLHGLRTYATIETPQKRPTSMPPSRSGRWHCKPGSREAVVTLSSHFRGTNTADCSYP